MAIDILRDITVQSLPGYQPVKHETKHDLESLVWVVYFALYRKAWTTTRVELRNALEEHFKSDFGLVPVDQIHQRRRFVAVERFRKEQMENYFDLHDMALLEALLVKVDGQNPALDRYWRLFEGKGGQEPLGKGMTCADMRESLARFIAKNEDLAVPESRVAVTVPICV